MESPIKAETGNHPDYKQNIDYSEIYRKQELKQLEKRLKKTRNILLLCAFFVLGGALVFWMMPETSFKTRDLLSYSGLAFILVMLAIFSRRRPYVSVLTGLVICILFWGAEIVLNTTDDFLIEGSIQKLVIISLLVIRLHASKEAELIRKELHFS